MTRFKEGRRIENAIKHRNLEELHWAKNYIEMRLGIKDVMHPTKIAKHADAKWSKRLNDVLSTIELIKEDQQ